MERKTRKTTAARSAAGTRGFIAFLVPTEKSHDRPGKRKENARMQVGDGRVSRVSQQNLHGVDGAV